MATSFSEYTETPKPCKTVVDYRHSTLCSPSKPFDCNCSLCAQPYSSPYVGDASEHLSGMKQVYACKNPNCKCTDCSGECKCSAGKINSINIIEGMQAAVNFQPMASSEVDQDWGKYLLFLLLVVVGAVYILRRR